MSKGKTRGLSTRQSKTSNRKEAAAQRVPAHECKAGNHGERKSSRRVRHQPTPADPPLLRVLLHQADRRGHTVAAMAAELGVSPGYIFQLRNGLRQTEFIGQEFAVACARYLRIPVVLVKLWAGRIRLTDFGWPHQAANAQRDRDLAELATDPAYAGLVPEELAHCSDAMKDLVWNLYCEATGRQPVTWVTMPKMLDYLQRAALAMEEHEAELRSLEALVEAGTEGEAPEQALAVH